MRERAMIEICCGSYEDALAADRGGAERIELNSALALGGLTPSAGCVKLVKKNTGLKVISMVRPRGAGFNYTEAETEQMFADGAELIHSFGKEAVFHRAYDCVKDPYEAMETLISLKIDRVLTSGLREKAVEGAELLRRLQAEYGSRIQILAGSGVNAGNAKALMAETGLTQVHSSCKDWRRDETTSGEYVNYRFAPAPHEDDYDVVSEELVRKLVEETR